MRMVLLRQMDDRNISVRKQSSEYELSVHSHDTIIDLSYCTPRDETWTLYCLTQSGALYRVDSEHVERSRVLEQTRSSDLGHQNEIFSELLSEENSTEIDLQLSTIPVYVLKDTDILLELKQKAVGICVGANHILILTEEAIFHKVQIYDLPDISEPFVTTVKTIKDAHCFNLNRERDHTYISQVVIKLVTCYGTECSDTDTEYSDVVSLDTSLFKLLFGESVALLNSPVMLLAEPDGSVYYYPLFNVGIHDHAALIGKPESHGIPKNGNGWILLCQMSSVVSNIVKVNVTLSEDEPELSCPALGVCGQDGKIILFHGSGKCQSDLIMSDFLLSGPVISVIGFHDRLYHSNGEHVVETCLVLSQMDNQSLSRFHIKVSTTRTVFTGYIKEIHAATSDGYTETKGSPCSIYCTQQNTEFKHIRVTTAAGTENVVEASGLENLKDILTAIEHIDKKREQVRQKKEEHKNVLQQLGVASYLLQSYLRDCSVDDEMKVKNGFAAGEENFSVSCKISRAGDCTENLVIKISISHKLPLSLSQDWVLSAFSLLEGDEDSSFCVSKQLDSDWKPNEKLSISLTEHFARLLRHVILQLKLTLRLDITQSFGEKLSTEGSSLQNYHCLSIPIFSQRLDVLQCFNLASDMKEGVVQVLSVNSKLQKLANGHHGATENLHKHNLETTVCTRNTVKIVSSGGRHQQIKDENDILKAIIGERQDLTEVTPSDCSFRTLLGHDVHLNILLVDITSLSNTRGDETVHLFEVVVRSPRSIAAAVHQAIQQRLQMLTQDHTEVHIFTTKEARQSLKLVQDLTRSYIGISMDEVQVDSLYERLRSLPHRL